MASAALVLLAWSAAAAAGDGGEAASLRRQTSVLDTRAHRAILDLYALDAHLEQARTQLAVRQSNAAHLRTRAKQLGRQISATRRTLTTSQHLLGAHLRTLYEEGDVSTLAVVLGAQSLDDAVTRLDDLSRIVAQNSQVAEVTSAARIHLSHARATLAEKRAQAGAAVEAARRMANELAAARSGRLAFIARLRGEQQLKALQIDALQRAARQVEARSQALQAAADTAASTPSSLSLPDPTAAIAAGAAMPSAPVSGGHTITVDATGYAFPGRTASGIPVGWGVVAVDPSVIPLGSRLTIPGYGDGVAADTGSAVRGATIDLWFPTLGQALAWGRRTVTITVH